MGDNTAFPNPQPALTEVAGAATALENAYKEALNGGRIQTAFMHQCELALDTLIVSLAGYVQSVSRGDETIILSSGFDTHNVRTQALRTIAAPVNVVGKMGAREGEINLSWDRVTGARAYNIEVSGDGLSNWTFYATVTKRRMVIGGLESGVKRFFRIAAVGAIGQSGWSDPGIGKAL
jgi:hypothetical protein